MVFILKVNIAGLNILIIHKHSHIKNISSSYLADFEIPDITLSVTDEECETEKIHSICDGTDGYFEAQALYRKLCSVLPCFDRLMLHSSAIKKGDSAICLVAPSGVGKTTHTRFLIDRFPNLEVVNGDKPILHFENDRITVYGTPFMGRENFGANISAILNTLCFLEQSEENRIVSLSPNDAVGLALASCLPPDSSYASKYLELINTLILNTKLYKMYCKPDSDSALLSYNIF